jgi:hypothetical protein
MSDLVLDNERRWEVSAALSLSFAPHPGHTPMIPLAIRPRTTERAPVLTGVLFPRDCRERASNDILRCQRDEQSYQVVISV